jgi:hypothetical protein
VTILEALAMFLSGMAAGAALALTLVFWLTRDAG